MARKIQLAVFALTLSLAVVARAQDKGAAPSETDASVARARQHFLLGMQFFEVRAYRDAIREFELATSIAPSADIWFNIGRAREELGEDEQAKGAFERYLRDRVDAPDAEAVRARIKMLEQRIATGQRGSAEPTSGTGSLRIHLPQQAASGALVTLDGKTLREPLRLEPVILPAGLHRLEVTRTGYVPFRAEVSIESGMLTATHPRLDRLTEAPSTRSHARSWTWVMLGVTGASALAAGIMGGIAAGRLADDAVSDARTWARRSDVALAGTAVCALAAAILYFVEAPPRSESPASSASAVPVRPRVPALASR